MGDTIPTPVTPNTVEAYFPRAAGPWQSAFLEALRNNASPHEAALASWASSFDLKTAGATLPKLEPVGQIAPPKAPSTSSLTAVRSVVECHNVRALGKPQNPIALSPWLTVFYGRNGSGKSSLARLLRAFTEGFEAPQLPGRASEDPAKDGYDKSRSCKIEAASGSAWRQHPASYAAGTTLEWSDKRAPAQRVALQILDREYLDRFDQKLRLALDPKLGLELFDQAGAALRSFSAGLAALKTALEKDVTNLFPVEDQPLANQAVLVASLAAESAEDLLAVRTKAEAQLASLRQSDKTVITLAARLTTIDAALAAVTTLQQPEADRAAVLHGQAEIARLEAAGQAGLAVLLQERALPIQDAAGWRAFILAGEAALREERRGTYPVEDDRCLYCGQTLEAAARVFLKRLRDELTGENEAALKRAREHQRAVRDALVVLQQRLALPEDLQTTEAWVEHLPAAAVLEKLQRDLEADRADIVRAQTELANPALLGKATTAAEQALETASLRAFAKQHADKLDRLRALRLVLAGVATAQSEVRSWQQQWSTKKTEAATALGLAEFTERFEKEHERLRVNVPIAIKAASPAGHTERRYKARGRDPRETLSESEVVAWATADLLAELDHRGAPDALLIDDPVSSMDSERMAAFVSRLMEECFRRQVIVFTHNRQLFHALVTAAKEHKGNPHFELIYHIEAFRDTTGYVSCYDRCEKPRALLERVRGLLAATPMDVNTVDLCFLLMRRAVEATIDQVVLRGVRTLYDPESKAILWSKLRAIQRPPDTTLKELEDVFSGMSRIGGLHVTGDFNLVCPITEDVRYYLDRLENLLDRLEAHHGAA